MNKTKRPKIEIGTTFPYFHDGRIVNAEVVACVKIGSRAGCRKRNWWTIELTESQRPILHAGGSLAGKSIGFETDTKSLADRIAAVESLPTFGPSAKVAETCVVQWVDFGGHLGLWAEIREELTYNQGRNTHWTRSEYGTVDELLASGDAVQA